MKEEQIIIDGENALLGRLASFSAKQALHGKEVRIVNAEKVVISGNRDFIIGEYLIKRKRRKVKFPSQPERILKRTIRGMLPHRKGHGLEAFRRIKCYIGMPEEFKNEKKIKSGKEKTGMMTLNELSMLLK